jgi:hypothetical protein
MLDHQAAVFARLTGDATLTALLAVYATAPAVFEDGSVPPELEHGDKPIIVVGAPSHAGDDDTFSGAMRSEQIGLRLYHKPEGASLPLVQAAERVRTLFKNWGAVAITGGTLIQTEVAGPIPAPTDDPSLDGRIVQLTLLIKET